MDDLKISILSTRPLSAKVLEQATEQNIILDCISYIETAFIESEGLKKTIKNLGTEKKAVVFTSMNSVEAVKMHLPSQPEWEIYCMGNTTRQLVENYFGKDHLKETATDAAALSKKIIDSNITEVVFFCGNIRRDELPEALQSNNIKVKEVIVYDTIETPVKLAKEYNAVLFFSPSAVRSFFKANKIPPQTVLFAIGNTTKKEIQDHSTNLIITSESAVKDDLATQAISYYTNKRTHEHQN